MSNMPLTLLTHHVEQTLAVLAAAGCDSSIMLDFEFCLIEC
jgi:hypothetical protein